MGLSRFVMSQQLVSTLCITRRGQEDYLCRELLLHSNKLTCKRLTPQVIVIAPHEENYLLPTPLFFSAQLLPRAELISAQSINQWAQTIFDRLTTFFQEPATPWCLHVFDPLTAESGREYARPNRIREALIALLKQKRRSLFRTLCETPDKDTSLVQVVTISPTEGYCSVAPPALRATYDAAISPHLAGYLAIPDDKTPPSRAFKKLQEAISIFHLSIRRGETAVDLGASPGGWTHVLRAYGAKVTAVDRSPLVDALMRDSGVTFIQGNALTWTPPKSVDWLVCDVITTPDNTAALLKRWIEKKLCRNFCVTVKFKGPPDLATLHALSEFLKDNTQWFDGRQLTHNKNEVTVVGLV
jgi:23S rRNA C2498 (ribose-2'-O)-methylase RlmM